MKTALNTSSVTKKRAFLGNITSMIRKKACEMCTDDDLVFDVGCGNGLFFALLNQTSLKKVKFIGLDYSEYLLNEAKNIFDDNRVKDFELIKGDIFMLPFKCETFKRVTCLNTILNIPTIEKVEKLLVELMNVCSPDGKILIDVRNRLNPYIRLKYWYHSKKAGFPTIAYGLNDIYNILNKYGFRATKRIVIGIPFILTASAFVLEIERINR